MNPNKIRNLLEAIIFDCLRFTEDDLISFDNEIDEDGFSKSTILFEEIDSKQLIFDCKKLVNLLTRNKIDLSTIILDAEEKATLVLKYHKIANEAGIIFQPISNDITLKLK